MLLLVRALIRKPVNNWSLPSSDLADVSASAPKATALTVSLTCLVTPASTTSDSCSRTKLEAGMPAGVQLIADYGREDLLIQLAALLEVGAPWSDRRPAVHA